MFTARSCFAAIGALVIGVTGCGGASGANTEIQSVPEQTLKCDAAIDGAIGVVPLKNKTEASVNLAGTDDFIMTSMTTSGCFQVLERDQLQLLIEEMRLCSQDNPDVEYFDCGSFAKKGQLLGAKSLVVGNLVYFTPGAKGAEVKLKIPGIGGIEAGRDYTALALNLRAVDVETAKVQASVDVHAIVPTDEAGASVSLGGFELGATAKSTTPLGRSLSDMLHEAVRKLHAQLK